MSHKRNKVTMRKHRGYEATSNRRKLPTTHGILCTRDIVQRQTVQLTALKKYYFKPRLMTFHTKNVTSLLSSFIKYYIVSLCFMFKFCLLFSCTVRNLPKYLNISYSTRLDSIVLYCAKVPLSTANGAKIR